MRYYIIAGEASGDLHASNLMHELKILDKEAEFRVWGGNLMQQQGGQIVKHYKELAFMGFLEVLMNIRKIKNNFELCRDDLLDFKPDILILVDYPGFNLRMAKFAKENNILTYYYISPKIWAWKKSRARKIKKYIDKMFVIFPFEKDFYKQYNYEVFYVGNPLIDELKKKQTQQQNKESFLKKNNLNNRKIIALLAGSRMQELKYILPEMLKTINYFPEYQFVLAGAPGIEKNAYLPYIKNYPVKLIFNQTYDLLKHAHAAIVTSGTATLETAMFNVPQVVVYKLNGLVYEIGKYFIKPKYFSLVNIIMNKTVVQELLQKNLPQKIKTELSKILYDKKYRQEMLENYKKLHQKIGEPGASRRTAEIIYNDLVSKK